MDTQNNTEDIYFKSKRVSLVILAVTTIICSRMLFFFFNDTEGPNLIVTIGFALAVFFLSWAAYVFGPIKMTGIKRLSVAICIQLLSVAGLYFFMK